jgi:hypothetical protein
MENIARSLAQRIPPPWGLRSAALLHFISAGSGQRSLGKSPVFRAHSRNGGNLLDRVSSEAKRKIRIYLDSGWTGDNYEATRSMRDRLIWKGYRPCSELFYLAFPEAKHDETAWAARSPIPFQFLFGKVPLFSKPRQPRIGHKKSASSAFVQSSGFQRRLRK